MKTIRKNLLLVALIIFVLSLASLACSGTDDPQVGDLYTVSQNGELVDMNAQPETSVNLNPIDAIGDAVCNIDSADCHAYDNSREVLGDTVR